MTSGGELRNAVSMRDRLTKQCERLETQVKLLEKEKLQNSFLNKQNSAWLRKLEKECISLSKKLKEVQQCAACVCLNENRRKPVKIVTAQVQDIRSKVPFSVSNVRCATDSVTTDSNDVLGHRRNVSSRISSLQNELEAHTRAIDKIRGSIPQSHTVSSLLIQKDQELQELKDKIRSLETETKTLKNSLSRCQGVSEAEQRRFADSETDLLKVQAEMKRVATDLLKLKKEKEQLAAENDLIRHSLSAKETNLQRCESQLREALKETQHLKVELSRYHTAKSTALSFQANSTPSVESAGKSGKTWRSELELSCSRPKSSMSDKGHGGRNVNPYCASCRNFKNDLAETRSCDRRRKNAHSPDSGYGDKDTSANDSRKDILQEIRGLSVENRKLKDEIQSLRVDRRLIEAKKERALKISKQMESENRSLRQEILSFKVSGSRNSPESPSFRPDGDPMKEKLLEAKSQYETDRARHSANYSLLKAQKTQVEYEKKELQNENQKLRDRLNALLSVKNGAADPVNQRNGCLLKLKDAEIAQLKSTIRDLDKEYEEFRGSLREQEEALLRLQHDLSVSESLKGEAEREKVSVSEEHCRLQNQLMQQIEYNKTLERELELSVEEQERLKMSTQRYLNEVQTYEKLLSEKEKERMELLLKLQRTSSLGPMDANQSSTSLDVNLRDLEIQALRTEIDNLKSDKSAFLGQEAALEQQLKRCQDSLEELKKSLREARLQNDSLHADLASLRQMVVQMDGEKAALSQQIREKDIELRNIRTTGDDLRGELEMLRRQIFDERERAKELEESLSSSREQQVQAAVDVQEKIGKLRELRMKVADCETQMELQGRELKRLREESVKGKQTFGRSDNTDTPQRNSTSESN